MKVLRVVLTALLLIVVLVVAVAAGLFLLITRSPLPQTSGSIAIAGLDGPVEILRDEWGVPHIYASTTRDLFFAQGYTQAQDRWWQMEFFRNTGSGTIQELTGKNEGLMGTDIFIRTVGWRRAAERDIDAYQGESLAQLQAFADGVNAYILNRDSTTLALEYRVLGLTGVNIPIKPWTPVDTIVWGKVMAWNLTDSYGSELIRATLYDELGREMAEGYTPPWPYGEKPTILAPEDLPISQASLTTTDALGTAEIASWSPSSLLMAGDVRPGQSTTHGADVGIGSNNWVSTGAQTASGLPMLANDPHLSIQMPSIWYEIGLHCQPVSDACPFNVVGFTFSPVPGVIVGHNDRIAWGVTNVGADVQDLYRIRVNPDNPLQYEWNGTWRDMTVYEETIQFGDGEAPITIQVRETHLGPIINDNRIDSDSGLPSGFNNEDPLALRWTSFDPGTIFESVLHLNQASNWEEFRDALRLWDSPSQNFVYADIDGNIGYQTPGNLPIRAADHDGLTPAEGWTDAYEWQGYVPFDSLPRIFNPAREFIVTANQAVVPMEYYDQLTSELGDNANYLLSYDWSYGYRGQRINELMESLAPHTPESYRVIHGDNKQIVAEEMMPYLNALSFDDPALSETQAWLAGWDYQAGADSPHAAFFAHFLVSLLRNLYADQLPDGIEASSHQMWPAVLLMAEAEHVWWDDAATADVTETRDDILSRAFRQAYDAAVAAQGENRDNWRWGDLHTATFVSNPLGVSGIDIIEGIVNRGPVATGGGSEIVNATGWDVGGGNFEVSSVPSMRMIIDLSSFDSSQSMHTTGQSGHPYSDLYGNMIDPWRAIEYHPMLWTREAVEAAAKERLTLTPSN